MELEFVILLGFIKLMSVKIWKKEGFLKITFKE